MHRTRAQSIWRSTRSWLTGVALGLLCTPHSAAALQTCVGDCSADGEVTVNELIAMVNVALGSVDVSTCLPGDADGDGTISINEIIIGVNNALNGCVSAPTPTPTGGTHSYVGDYSGTAGSYGVRFHVDADGSADGFLDFLTPDGAGGATEDGSGAGISVSYPAAGATNLTTGAYQLAGSFFGNNFDFSGQLPASPDAVGSLSVTVFGQTSQGSLQSGTGPMPTPTPGCDAANLQMTVSAVSGNFNGIASNFVAERMTVASEGIAPDYIPGLNETFNSTLNGTECTQQGARLRNVQISTFAVIGGLAGGQSFPIGLSSTGAPIGVVMYGEEGAGGDRVWTASSGTLFVDALNGSVVTLRVVGATMTETAGPATGQFTLDVSGQVNTFVHHAP